jgi:hypothetical protein
LTFGEAFTNDIQAFKHENPKYSESDAFDYSRAVRRNLFIYYEEEPAELKDAKRFRWSRVNEQLKTGTGYAGMWVRFESGEKIKNLAFVQYVEAQAYTRSPNEDFKPDGKLITATEGFYNADGVSQTDYHYRTARCSFFHDSWAEIRTFAVAPGMLGKDAVNKVIDYKEGRKIDDVTWKEEPLIWTTYVVYNLKTDTVTYELFEGKALKPGQEIVDRPSIQKAMEEQRNEVLNIINKLK